MRRTRDSSPGLARLVKAALALGVAGCSFQPAGQATDGGQAADAAEDAGDAGDAAGPDAPPGGALCAAPSGDLLLCLSFDGGGAANEAAGGVQPMLETGTAVVGRVGQGRGFDGTQGMWWPDAAPVGTFDLQAPFTLEMFVMYTTDPPHTGPPGDQRSGLLDANGQYSMFLGWHDPDGAGPLPEQVTPYCNINGTVWGAPISRDRWHHVACVFDDVAAAFTMYVDGVPGETRATATPVQTGNTDGLTLAQDCTNLSSAGAVEDGLTGGLDEVRLWRVARTPAQILAAAQRGQ
ncbi:MAG: LamG domain-containing protein [Kofleriaceae bacterium]